MNMMYFLVIAVCVVIIFYQFSEVTDKLGNLINTANSMIKATRPQSLIPAG